MGATITTPSVTAVPPQVVQPIIQIKQDWQDFWAVAPELLASNISTASAGQDLSRLVFHRRYGSVKDTYQTDFATRTETDLTDWWIRVRALNAEATDLQTVWLGRISGDDATKYASSAVPAGVQQWVAYGGAQILRKRAIGRSFHLRDGQVQDIGWVPPLNDPAKSEVGNRSSGTGDGVYMYGGEELWNYRQYVEYLLAKFLDESAAGGPEWTLTGQADVLEKLSTPIRWGTTQTVYQMLRRLIPLDRGIDYTVRIVASHTPSEGADIPEAGFEIFVYAVSPIEYTFAGVTMPKNPLAVPINAGTANDLHPSPRIIASHDRKFKRIRALGKRIVVCCSLWAAKAPAAALVPETTVGIPSYSNGGAATLPSLVKKWEAAIEAEYKTGAVGKDDEADHDEYRRQDKFQDVYASFGAPVAWDMNGGTAAPWCDAEGTLRTDDPGTGDDESIADYQTILRRTLSWIPLKEGEDWTNIAAAASRARGTPTDVDDHQADYLPPIAWLFDLATFAFTDSSKLGVGVRPKRHDWGVLLRASPNHIMGQNHFGNEGESALKTAKWPRYDWQELAVTIAFESDQRYTMEWAHPDATAKDGVLELEVDAELHYLAPNTIVATPYPDSTPAVVLSGDEGRVIREDRELMGLVMAGAISRYGYGRNRASVAMKGLVPCHDLIGQILTTIEESGNSHVINGPITGVTWDMALSSSPSTVIRAGYAS
jgi:hypothetical protein